jgi:hypothetical protein
MRCGACLYKNAQEPLALLKLGAVSERLVFLHYICYSLSQIVLKFSILLFTIDGYNFNLLKVARDFNRDHITIVRLVWKFNRTESVDDLPRRPKHMHRATIRQQDRYMQVLTSVIGT